MEHQIIDCINVYEQLAFQHPLLVNHTLQLKPNYPGEINDYTYEPSPASNTSKICPEGSIPVERIQRNDHVRGNLSLYHAYKHPHYFLKRRGIQQNSDPNTHEQSAIGIYGDNFYGVRATLNLWNPKVEKDDESSTSQVWIIGKALNSLQAGWMVAPSIYGTRDTRFFTYWTVANQETGCLNLRCPGFVQTTPHTVLGGIVRTVSVVDGTQYAMDIEIFQDKTTKNWWLRLNGVDIGYWPKDLLPFLLDGTNAISLGGEVYYQGGGAHTSAQMGSGHYAEDGFKKASFIQNIKVLDTSNAYVTPSQFVSRVDAEGCYNMKIGSNTRSPSGLFLFFGGPGRSEKCT